jgi:hypothetical protein
LHNFSSIPNICSFSISGADKNNAISDIISPHAWDVCEEPNEKSQKVYRPAAIPNNQISYSIFLVIVTLKGAVLTDHSALKVNTYWNSIL